MACRAGGRGAAEEAEAGWAAARRPAVRCTPGAAGSGSWAGGVAAAAGWLADCRSESSAETHRGEQESEVKGQWGAPLNHLRNSEPTERPNKDWRLTLASDMVSFRRGGRGGGFSCSSPSWCRLSQDADWNSERGGEGRGENVSILLPLPLPASG